MKKILILTLTLLFSLYAKSDYVVIDDDMDKNLITVQADSYKILEFPKMISKVKVNDNNQTLKVSFIKNKNKPLQTLKVYANKKGTGSIFVNFIDQTHTQVKFSVMQDFSAIVKLAKKIAPELIVEEANGDIVLKGNVKTNKDKTKIIDLFKKANVDIDNDLIDLIVVVHPDRMLRIKLHVTEIDNDEGLDIKNQWAIGHKDFQVYEDGEPIIKYDELQAKIENSVTLSGGLSAAANALGENFNVGFVLNYLSTEGVAKVLDETTLITLENKEAKFHAGGTIYLKVQTTTAEGLPSTEIRPIKYGLELIVKAKDIINNEFVDLEITTKSTQIDFANQVDGIPSFRDKTIETFVLSKNKATVVLGGLITSQDVKTYSKIPLLGDIPVLGALFRSKNFVEGKSELVFFITPEIVDVGTNEQKQKLIAKKEEIVKDIKFEEIKD